MKTYEYHPLASLLPLLDDEDFDSLVEDIREYGQIEPITLFEGKILDGRNRYKACLELGIEVKVKEWMPSELNGLTPLQYVISENIMRRHLNTAQRSEIGLVLLEEEEKLAKERLVDLAKNRPRDKNGKLLENKNLDNLVNKEKNGTFGVSTQKVGKKVKVSHMSISQAKKVAEVAETEPLIKQEWEKAKQGEQGVAAVYEKAKIMEDIKTLPKKEQEEIKKAISNEPVSKVKEVVKEKKDDQRREENAKKFRELQKRRQEMEKLKLQITSTEKTIQDLEGSIKSFQSNLKILAEESLKKYPEIRTLDPEIVITQLSLKYDNLDTKEFDGQLKSLKDRYDEKRAPLLIQLKQLEEEYEERKQDIELAKKKRSTEINWLEKQEDSLHQEFSKIEAYQKRIEEHRDKLSKMKERFDNEFRELEGI